MQRAPLKEVLQTDTMSGENKTKLTPEKTRDWAAAAAAAKLLGSAKKSQTKKVAKRMKLSLQKPSAGGGVKKSSARTLALSTGSDLNDTIEFKDGVSSKAAAKLSLATRKRKKSPHAEQVQRTKNFRREDKEAQVCDTAQTCRKLAEQSAETSKNDDSGDNWQQTATAESETDSLRPASSCEEEGAGSPSEKDLSVSLHTCPACGQMLRRGRFVHHIQLCLKQHFGREEQADTNMRKDDEEMGSIDTEPNENQQTRNSGEKEALPAEYIFCQLCQKDLSHMNTHRRGLHINNCIDQEEKKKKEVEEKQQALEAAKTQVLDCPMCGKGLRTVASRKSHLKKCASSLGVQTEQLLAAVKRQEEEHLAKLDAGILPQSYRPGRSTRQIASSTCRGLASVPKSKLDEDTQLALAISSSLQADLTEAGPSTTGNSAAPNRRGRKNKQEEDYLLLTLTQAQASGRVETRVSDLIMQQEEEEEEEDIPPLPVVSREALLGEGVRGVHWSSDEAAGQSKMLWRQASLEDQLSATTEINSDASLEFYVRALMPPVEVSTVAAGSKIRRMSEIPGRRHSLDARAVVETEETSEQDDDGVAEDMPPPSTQTVALLADLAAEADGIDQTQRLPSTQLLSCPQRQAQQDLLTAFASLVNQEMFSDVVIHAAGATTLYAHRVILSVRCPALLRLSNEGGGEVDLSDCSPHCMLALLEFLYAGVTEMDQQWVPGTLQLAQRLGLTTLAEICANQQLMSALPNPTGGDTENDEDNPMNTSDSISISIFTESESGDTEESKREGMAETSGVCGHREQNGVTAVGTDPIPREQRAGMDQGQSLPTDQENVCDSEQLGISRQQGPESEAGLPDMQAEQTNSASQTDSRWTGEDRGFHYEQIIARSQEASASQGRPRADLPDQGGAVNDSITGNSSFANLEDKFLLAEFEKELTEKIKVVCDIMDKDTNVAMEQQPTSASHVKTVGGSPVTTRTTLDKARTRESSDDDICLLDVPPQSDVRGQILDRVNGGCATGDLGRTEKEKPPQALEVMTKNYHQIPEPVDSIEISDDDLFSGDEIDVSPLPNTPQNCGQNNSAVEGSVRNSGWKCNTKHAVESGAGISTDGGENVATSLASPQKKLSVEHQQDREQCERKCAEEEESIEKIETQFVSLTSTDSGDPPAVLQSAHKPAVEGDFASFSVSAVEPSGRLSSLFSPNVQCFKTSTPQQSADSKQTPCTGRKGKTAGDKNLCESTYKVLNDATAMSKAETEAAEMIAVQSGGLTVASGSSSPAVGSNSVSAVGAKQTPCMSVVEQDSLYITPAVEQSKIRRTFQLTTPLSQQKGAYSVSATPTSCYAARETLPQTQTSSSWGGNNAYHKEDEKQSGRGGCGGESNQGQAYSGKNASQLGKSRESDEVFGGEIVDSDSDLEIIDTSLQDPPSPKFSVKSKPSSSQSRQEVPLADQTSPHRLLEEQSRTSRLISSQLQPKPDNQPKSLMPSARQPGSSGHRFSQGNDSSPAKSNLKSPGNGSPSSPFGSFSQRSVDSDKELLRVVELVSKQVMLESIDPQKAASSPTSKGGAEPLCDTEMTATGTGSPSEEDVWEGFDNMDVYNPDLDRLSHDPAFSQASCNVGLDSSKAKMSMSPGEIVSSDLLIAAVGPPSSHSPDRFSAPHFKTPMKLPVKVQEQSPNISPKKCLVASATSPQRQPFSPKQGTSTKLDSEHNSTPVRFRSSSASQVSTKASSGEFEDKKLEAGKHHSQQEGRKSPEGFFLDADDSEAANSSFLWSAENAPVMEEGGPAGGDLSEGEAALELGREETVLTHDLQTLSALTPTVSRQSKKRGQSTWVPPSPFTPMPAYDAMTTPDLKHEVQKYGLKPVGKKRMKLVLKDLYDKTHQYETDSDCELDSADLPYVRSGPTVLSKQNDPSKDKQGKSQQRPLLNKKSNQPGAQQPAGSTCSPLSHKQLDRRRLKATEQSVQPSVMPRRLDSEQQVCGQHPAGQKETEPLIQRGGKKGSKPKRSLAGEMAEPEKAQSAKRKPTSKKTAAPKTMGEVHTHPSQQSPSKRGSGDGGKQKQVHIASPVKSTSDYSSSPEKGSVSSSQGSNASEQPDVSVFEEQRVDSDDEDDISPSQQSAAQELPQKLMQFFQNHPGLCNKVLTYEPLDLAVLREDLKVAGIRCSHEKLLNFLDEKCITFTSKNLVPRSRRNRGRKPRAKKLAASQK